MEKSMPEKLKEIPAWINEVPLAKAYINAVIAGNGDRLFRVIKMIGNRDAYRTCVSDFADILFSMNMVDDKRVSATAAGKIHSNVEQVLDKPGNYWFFDDDHNPLPGTKMVIFNIKDVKARNEKIKQLIEKIGLIVDYSTMSMLLKDYPGWEEIDEDVFINNTILSHYSTCRDDILKAPDLEWIHDVLIGNDAINLNYTEPETVKDNEEQETGMDNEKPEFGKDIPVENSPDNKDTDETPIPEVTEDDQEEETVESALEKIAYNKKLNAEMYEIYEQTAKRLKDERDLRWKDFILEYKKAIEDENYTVRTCPRYLDMTSRDVKAPVYKVLYEADQATKRYERELKRIRRKTLCFACHKTFDADITFAKHKEHVVRCPNCGNLIRLTIDWLK